MAAREGLHGQSKVKPGETCRAARLLSTFPSDRFNNKAWGPQARRNKANPSRKSHITCPVIRDRVLIIGLPDVRVAAYFHIQ